MMREKQQNQIIYILIQKKCSESWVIPPNIHVRLFWELTVVFRHVGPSKSSNIAGKNQTKHITWFLHLFRISDPSNILITWWLQPNKSRKTSDLRLPVFNRNHQAIRIRLTLRLDGMKHFLFMLVKLLFVFRKGFLPCGCKQWLLQTSVNKGSVHLVCQGGWNFHTSVAALRMCNTQLKSKRKWSSANNTLGLTRQCVLLPPGKLTCLLKIWPMSKDSYPLPKHHF